MAERAAFWAATFPSLVLWSSLNIRDAWVVLLILFICREALRLQNASGGDARAAVGAAVLVLSQFRDYILFAVTAAHPALVPDPRARPPGAERGARHAGGGRRHLRRPGGGQGRPLRFVDLEALQEMRQFTSIGGSAYQEQVDISTPGRALAFLPKGLAFFLFAPYPWTVRNVRQLVTLPEMLLFYALVPSMLRGARDLVRARAPGALMLALITISLTLGYALGEANAGAAYRHRAQVLVFLLLFAAAGAERPPPRRAPEAWPLPEAV